MKYFYLIFRNGNEHKINMLIDWLEELEAYEDLEIILNNNVRSYGYKFIMNKLILNDCERRNLKKDYEAINKKIVLLRMNKHSKIKVLGKL